MDQKKNIILIIIFGLLFSGLQAQRVYEFTPAEVEERLRTDIYNLSSEDLEGRSAGQRGERLAAEYIAAELREANIPPAFEDGYFQYFDFKNEWEYGDYNALIVDENQLVLNGDYYVFPFSARDSIVSKAVYLGDGWNKNTAYDKPGKVKGKIFIIDYYLPETLEQTFEGSLEMMLSKKINLALEHGAAGIIFINPDDTQDDPRVPVNTNLKKFDIPIIFAYDHFFKLWQSNKKKEIILSTDAQLTRLTSINVAGYINNNAESTIVIGGHYDHLGFGEFGSRKPQSGELHPGADDNASGTAGVMEAARYYSSNTNNDFNYLFVAFGAEERGLIGSKYFARNFDYNWEGVDFMINFDMIGRMEDNNLTIFGTGTSPVWDSILDAYPSDININKVASGVGASDHTNFYMLDIPVLFLFTGLHNDYHTPEDTPDKINFEGTREVLDLAYYIIDEVEKTGKPEFTKTSVQQTRKRSGGPTLGFMPDHTFEGVGLRIQAVMDGRPAKKGGLVKGDVIIRINEHSIGDIYDYMNTMKELKKGEQIEVDVKREDKTLTKTVTL